MQEPGWATFPLPLDVLIVDEIGKNISGAGMDTKVVNRSVYGEYNPWPDLPRIERIFVRDLSAAHLRQRRGHRHGGRGARPAARQDRLGCNHDQFADRLHAHRDPHSHSLRERSRVPGADLAP